jgi:ribosomal protein S18 acetylase RimI-like enzyme
MAGGAEDTTDDWEGELLAPLAAQWWPPQALRPEQRLLRAVLEEALAELAAGRMTAASVLIARSTGPSLSLRGAGDVPIGMMSEAQVVLGPTHARSATSDEMSRAIAAIVAAFVTDPIARFAWPSPHDYLRAMPLATREFAGGSFEHGTAYVTADFCGTALWLPPGVHPNGEALERVFRDTAKPEHLDDLLVTFEKMEQWHPEEPHWYLPMIGVEPNAQGKGLGADLMRHAVARCDHEGALAYLESSNPRNISLYLRSGFEVMGEIRICRAPVVTPMLRRPR